LSLKLTVSQYIEYFNRASNIINQNKEYITQLDLKTGDGDHWINLNKGFSELLSKAKQWGDITFSEMMKNTGMILMSKVGGSSGVLYGSAYIEASKLDINDNYIDEIDILNILKIQLEAIMKRGKTKVGDKTMVDSLYQGIIEFEKKLNAKSNLVDAFDALSEGARRGMESTKDMKASKGRASYQNNKGLGELDPGAVTMYYQIDALAKTCKEAYKN
jgi:dihydroxyacetone kinase-like protein